jgi:hypothetical protein
MSTLRRQRVLAMLVGQLVVVMETVDNAVMLLVPGAMHAGLASPLFWGALAFAFLVAFVVTVPVNRWLIARGKGHAVVHRYHHADHPAVAAHPQDGAAQVRQHR